MRRAVLSALVTALFLTLLAAPAGAAVTRLTSNAAFDLGSVYSPNGNWIAFISNRPAGDFGTGWNNVFVMNADGTNETNITCTSLECGNIDAQRPLAWAPDGSDVVFSSQGEIYRANANGSGVTNLTSSPDWGGSRPIYSPNGSRIFFEGNGISVMDADGSNPQVVVPTGYHFDVSPAGGRLAYACLGGCSGGIHVVDFDGTGDVELTGGSRDHFPTFSPDGNQVIFVRDFPDTHTADLFRINVDGTGLTRLTNDGRYSGGGVFDWSSDGTKIAYEWSTADESQFGVAVVNTRDGSSRQIFGTAASDDGDPTFSPNSMKLAYFSDQNDLGNVDVYTETVYTATADAAPLSTTSTDSGAGATESDPTTTSVFTYTGGTVSIQETAELTQQAPPEYRFVGEQVNIEAPSSTEATPLGISFRLDASLIPAGENERTVQVFRNGVLVPDCSGPGGVASPDPCVADRSLLEDGDIWFELLTSHASAWNFGVALVQPYLAGRLTGAGILAAEDGARVRHTFDLQCDRTQGPNRLEVATGSATFSLQHVTRVVCHDDATAGAVDSRSGFDTHSGEGTGVLDGLPARAEWRFVDNGEPGHADVGRIVIENASGGVVLTASGTLIGGNYQAKG
jgi:Tol biopolymer transport system component